MLLPLLLKQPMRRVKHLPRRIFVADGGPDMLAVARRLPPGTGVLLRAYDAPGRERLAACLARIARERRLLLLVAGDAGLARRVGAAGVHLPEWRLAGRRPPLRRGALLTAACHSRRALARAARMGADAALVSPVFATASHPDAPPLGPHRFARLVSKSPLPVYALGGVNADTMRRLPPGLAGIAAISAFCDQKFSRVPR